MALKDVLKKTVDDCKKLSKKKKDKRPLFSFGSDMPDMAVEESSGDVRLWIPSGNTLLDCALGGGMPTGRISEVYSDHESEGKTTTAHTFVPPVQKIGGSVILLESESAIDKPRARALGLDLENMVVWTPDTL